MTDGEIDVLLNQAKCRTTLVDRTGELFKTEVRAEVERLEAEVKRLKAREQALLEACNAELERRRKAEMDLEMARLDTQHWQQRWQEALKEKEEDPICPV